MLGEVRGDITPVIGGGGVLTDCNSDGAFSLYFSLIISLHLELVGWQGFYHELGFDSFVFSSDNIIGFQVVCALQGENNDHLSEAGCVVCQVNYISNLLSTLLQSVRVLL